MTLKLFISYAHKDQAAKAKFIDLLTQYTNIAAGIDFKIWQDIDILPGQPWDDEIKKALHTCDYGLLLVSPAFLGRDYIVNTELPALLEKRIIPVALERIRFDGTMRLHGLDQRQLFHNAAGQSFGEIATPRQRRAFVDELFGKLMNLVRVPR